MVLAPALALALTVGCRRSEPAPPSALSSPTTSTAGAGELCNGIDDDGDDEIDEGLRRTYYRDQDGDGLGDPASAQDACFRPVGTVDVAGDCDDNDPELTGPVEDQHFVDVSDEAGLRGLGPSWTGWNGCIHEGLGGGAAVGDIDGDGDLDVFLPRIYAEDQLLVNDGAGRFTKAPGFLGSVDASNGASFVDIDGDRDLDLIVSQVGELPLLVYVNDGSGRFEEEALARGAAIGGGPGLCSDQFGISAADVDMDGDVDLLVAAWQEENRLGQLDHTRLLLNDGGGVFTDGTVAAGLDALWQRAAFGALFADRDGDGAPDLHLVADWGGSGLLLNDGAGRFTEVFDRGVFTDENGMGSDLDDVDGDGDFDWFVSSVWQDTEGSPCPPSWGCTGNRLYADDGQGALFDATDTAGVREGQWGWGSAFVDYDGDGWSDLVMTGGMAVGVFWGAPGRLWRNRGDGAGVFDDVTCKAGWIDRRLGRGVIPFDADGDGDPDLLVTGSGDEPALWRNVGSEAQGWLTVDLDQPGANRFGIGAVVELTVAAGAVPQRRLVHANPSYVSGRPPLASFGLGGHPGAVDEVVVTWPDGERTVHRDVAPGRAHLSR